MPDIVLALLSVILLLTIVTEVFVSEELTKYRVEDVQLSNYRFRARRESKGEPNSLALLLGRTAGSTIPFFSCLPPKREFTERLDEGL
jgi:hypothetical protein